MHRHWERVLLIVMSIITVTSLLVAASMSRRLTLPVQPAERLNSIAIPVAMPPLPPGDPSGNPAGPSIIPVPLDEVRDGRGTNGLGLTNEQLQELIQYYQNLERIGLKPLKPGEHPRQAVQSDNPDLDRRILEALRRTVLHDGIVDGCMELDFHRRAVVGPDDRARFVWQQFADGRTPIMVGRTDFGFKGSSPSAVAYAIPYDFKAPVPPTADPRKEEEPPTTIVIPDPPAPTLDDATLGPPDTKHLPPPPDPEIHEGDWVKNAQLGEHGKVIKLWPNGDGLDVRMNDGSKRTWSRKEVEKIPEPSEA